MDLTKAVLIKRISKKWLSLIFGIRLAYVLWPNIQSQKGGDDYKKKHF